MRAALKANEEDREDEDDQDEKPAGRGRGKSRGRGKGRGKGRCRGAGQKQKNDGGDLLEPAQVPLEVNEQTKQKRQKLAQTANTIQCPAGSTTERPKRVAKRSQPCSQASLKRACQTFKRTCLESVKGPLET